jgi:hypothetical protein
VASGRGTIACSAFLINPVASITPPVAAEASTTETCVLRRFTGRDSIRGRAAPGTLPRGLEEEREQMPGLLLYPQKEAGFELETGS